MGNESEFTAVQTLHETKYSWSLLGRVVLMLLPAAIWLILATYTQELKPLVEVTGNQPSVFLVAEVGAVFMARMGAIVMSVLVLLLLLRGPSSSMPRWMVVKTQISQN